MIVPRIVPFVALTALSLAVVIFLCVYGPSRRSFVSPTAVVSVDTPAQIVQAWESSGVKGRIAICFTRYLNAHDQINSKDEKAIEISLNHNIVRKAIHIPPDNAWPDIHKTLSQRNIMRPTPEGFIGVFDDGRVYIQPLSRAPDVAEKSLVVVEPAVWTREELISIAEKLKSGRLSTDLLVVIRGSREDAELFRKAMAR